MIRDTKYHKLKSKLTPEEVDEIESTVKLMIEMDYNKKSIKDRFEGIHLDFAKEVIREHLVAQELRARSARINTLRGRGKTIKKLIQLTKPDLWAVVESTEEWCASITAEVNDGMTEQEFVDLCESAFCVYELFSDKHSAWDAMR